MRAEITRESTNAGVNNSKFMRGDTERIIIRIVGQGLLTSNFKFNFTAKRSIEDSDADAVISKTSAENGGITISQPAANLLEAIISLLSEDTSILRDEELLIYDIQMVSINPASTRTLEKGKFTIIADVTQDNNG